MFVSRVDADKWHEETLRSHMVPLIQKYGLRVWSESDVLAGADGEQKTRHHFDDASIVLLLVTKDYLASSRHCQQMEEAARRHRAREVRVVPIWVSYCLWSVSEIRDLHPLPSKRYPVQGMGQPDLAWYEVTCGVRAVVREQLALSLATDSEAILHAYLALGLEGPEWYVEARAGEDPRRTLERVLARLADAPARDGRDRIDDLLDAMKAPARSRPAAVVEKGEAWRALVVVDPDGFGRYDIRAVLVSPGGRVDKVYESDQSVSQNEIRKHVEAVVDRMLTIFRHQPGRPRTPGEFPRIEVALPRNLLSLDVERWGQNPLRPYGTTYRTVVRSFERLFGEQIRGDHLLWWEAKCAHRDTAPPDPSFLQWVHPEEAGCRAAVSSAGMNVSCVGLKRPVNERRLRKEEADVRFSAIRAGIPAMLWLRRSPPDEDAEALLAPLLAGADPRRLPEWALEQRKRAAAAGGGKRVPAEGALDRLTLLWDEYSESIQRWAEARWVGEKTEEQGG